MVGVSERKHDEGDSVGKEDGLVVKVLFLDLPQIPCVILSFNFPVTICKVGLIMLPYFIRICVSCSEITVVPKKERNVARQQQRDFSHACFYHVFYNSSLLRLWGKVRQEDMLS